MYQLRRVGLTMGTALPFAGYLELIGIIATFIADPEDPRSLESPRRLTFAVLYVKNRPVSIGATRR